MASRKRSSDRSADATDAQRGPLRYWEHQREGDSVSAPVEIPRIAKVAEPQLEVPFPPNPLAERERLRGLLNQEQPAEDSHGSQTFGLKARDEWERVLEKRTRAFREAQADAHRDKARIAQVEGERKRYEWHTQRATGQDERFQRIANCGNTEIHIHCEECGHDMTQLVFDCKQWRVCRGCRGKRAAQYQARFSAARSAAVKAAQAAYRPGAPGGRWGESFLTMTLPHSGDIKRDIKSLPGLWREFRRMARQYLVADIGVDEDRAAFPYVRVIEVTAGEDRLGHAHLHAWLLSPYLPHACLRFWWGKALMERKYKPPMRARDEVITPDLPPRLKTLLERVLVVWSGRACYPMDPVPWPVLDIRACYGEVQREFIKYLVKDAERGPDGELQFMDPVLYADIYQGLERVRGIQTSSGFWPKDNTEGDVLCCEKCGGKDLTSTRRDRKTGQPVEGRPKRPRRPKQPKQTRTRDRRGVTPAMADTLEQMLPDCQNAAPPPRPKKRRGTSP